MSSYSNNSPTEYDDFITDFISVNASDDIVFDGNLEDYTISLTNNISYKYAEDRILQDLKSYIDDTYGQHYKTNQQSIECFDAWIAMGESTPTFRNTAIKYLWRYGKKHGNNKDDLMKALHYVMMCLYVDHYRNEVK